MILYTLFWIHFMPTRKVDVVSIFESLKGSHVHVYTNANETRSGKHNPGSAGIEKVNENGVCVCVCDRCVSSLTDFCWPPIDFSFFTSPFNPFNPSIFLTPSLPLSFTLSHAALTVSVLINSDHILSISSLPVLVSPWPPISLQPSCLNHCQIYHFLYVLKSQRHNPVHILHRPWSW